jgi:Uma2 family endonuclease
MIEPMRMTIAEFDRWVETAPEGFNYELQDGVVYSFASGSVGHGLLCTRLGGWLVRSAEAPCRVFFGSLSVRRNPERPSSVIPDVLLTCEEMPISQMYTTAPKLVVEVISPTSVVNDLNRKPRIYEAVASIEEYLVVDSRNVWARVFRRDEAGALPSEGEGATRADATIELQSVGLEFTLAELYAGILEVA